MKKKNEEWYDDHIKIYKRLTKKVETIVREILEDKKIPIHNVETRIKLKSSFLEKIARKNYSNLEEDMTDISGIRIIGYVDSDINKISKVIEDNFKIDKENSLDKSKLLGEDKVGYKSIHYIAELKEDRTCLIENKKFHNKKFEIQIRTILQHAWAEIEHDKNYKFSGELPKEIKRRFKMLAGLLEIADNEFERLAFEIDEYAKDIKEKTRNNELNIEINTATLKEFMNKEFRIYSNKNDNTINDNEIITVIRNFGIKNIYDLSKIIPNDFKESIDKYYNGNNTYYGIITDLLIITDCDKYFEKSWDNNWSLLETESIDFFKHYDIPIDNLMKKYDLGIEGEYED